MDATDLRRRYESIGQGHVFRFGESPRLMAQLAALDPAELADLAEHYVRNKPQVELPRDIRPVQAYPHHPGPEHKDLYDRAFKRGLELLRAGRVGAFLVAGGQGTRLGYDGPKGEFPVTPVKGKPLFQVFAEQLRAWAEHAGKPVPWYVMTSEVNDAPTRAFFEKHNHFGYPKGDVFFFQQGMMPAFAMDGKLLLGDRDSLALSPDGHGGSLRALEKSGALADMRRRGVEHLSYFQVDNPIVHTIDPLFLGLHDLTGSEMSSKTIAKAGPLEKVGNFCIGDGKLQVTEYSDLPEELAKKTNPDGSLMFNAGSIAIHALRVSFVERLNAGGRLELPWHRAEKKVPYVDDAGNLVKPDKVNAVKLEQFVFDAIPLAQNPIVYTTSRAEEFSPVKNAEGGDSPATSKRDQSRRHARWLESAGVAIPKTADGEPAATVEVSPPYAMTAEHLKNRLTRDGTNLKVAAGQSVYLGD